MRQAIYGSDQAGAGARQGQQFEDNIRDEPKGAMGADEELRQVVTGHVFDDRPARMRRPSGRTTVRAKTKSRTPP